METRSISFYISLGFYLLFAVLMFGVGTFFLCVNIIDGVGSIPVIVGFPFVGAIGFTTSYLIFTLGRSNLQFNELPTYKSARAAYFAGLIWGMLQLTLTILN